jgi:hypothetical protein
MLGLPIGRFIYVMATRGWWPGFAVFAYRHCVKTLVVGNARNDGQTVRLLPQKADSLPTLGLKINRILLPYSVNKIVYDDGLSA